MGRRKDLLSLTFTIAGGPATVVLDDDCTVDQTVSPNTRTRSNGSNADGYAPKTMVAGTCGVTDERGSRSLVCGSNREFEGSRSATSSTTALPALYLKVKAAKSLSPDLRQ